MTLLSAQGNYSLGSSGVQLNGPFPKGYLVIANLPQTPVPATPPTVTVTLNPSVGPPNIIPYGTSSRVDCSHVEWLTISGSGAVVSWNLDDAVFVPITLTTVNVSNANLSITGQVTPIGGDLTSGNQTGQVTPIGGDLTSGNQTNPKVTVISTDGGAIAAVSSASIGTSGTSAVTFYTVPTGRKFHLTGVVCRGRVTLGSAGNTVNFTKFQILIYRGVRDHVSQLYSMLLDDTTSHGGLIANQNWVWVVDQMPLSTATWTGASGGWGADQGTTFVRLDVPMDFYLYPGDYVRWSVTATITGVAAFTIDAYPIGIEMPL